VLASRLGRDKDLREDLYLNGSRQRHAIETPRRDGPPPPAPPGGATSVNWTPIGPSVVAHGQATNNPPVSGRMTSITVGPSGTRAYAGAANGGCWFTADGGTTWVPLDDFIVSGATTAGGTEADSLATGAVAVRFGAAAATDLVYVGTGEPNGSADCYFGIGIRRSAAGGTPGTWTLEATNLAGRGIYKIVIDPDSTATVLAATTAGLFRRPAAAPFATWTQVTSTFVAPNNFCTDLVVAGTGATKIYYCVFQGDTAYSSPDGITWTALTGIPAAGRAALAVGQAAPTVAYALKEDGTLRRLVGTAFQSVANVPPLFNIGGQGWYDIGVAVDPAGAVYLMGDLVWDSNWTLSLFKATVTGGPGTFSYGFNAANIGNPSADATYVGRNVHADGHGIAFALNAAGTAQVATDVWLATDGGIFRSTSSGTIGTFVSRNVGLAVTEMSFFSQRPDTDAIVISGCQDNGNVRFWGEPAWFEAPQGDGGGVGIDPNDQYQVIRQYAGLGQYWQDSVTLMWFYSSSFDRCTDGGASGVWSGLNFPPLTPSDVNQRNVFDFESARTGFYTPIAVTPTGVAGTMAAIGTHRVWLSTNWGTNWNTIPTNSNPYALAAPSTAQDSLDGTAIRSIEFASGTRLFAATSNAVWRLDLAGGVWTRTPITTAGLPAGHFITDLAVHNAAAGTFYVALGGGGLVHAWFFDGAAWQSAGPVVGTLDAPCHAIVVDPDNPNNVYLGSDVGVWKGTKTGATTWTWALYSQGLPEAAVTDLAAHRRARLLRAATHGRGVWEIQLDAVAGTEPELYLRVNTADTGRISGGSRFPWLEGAPDPRRKTFNVWHWQSPDIKVRRPSLGGPTLSTPPDLLDFGFNVGDYVDTSNAETADQTGLNRIFIQVHNRANERAMAPLLGTDVRVLLLLTDAAGGLPALPADYRARIIAGDTTNWVSGTPWRFADPMTPYRNLPGAVHARQTQVVFYDYNFTALGLPAGHDHVCAAAFVTTVSASDQLLAPGNTSLDSLTMIDRRVVHRNLHLVAAGAKPVPPGPGTFRQEPQTILIDFHNADREAAEIEVLVDRRHFGGRLSMLLPKLDLRGGEKSLTSWRIARPSDRDVTVREHAAFLEQIRKALANPERNADLKAASLGREPAILDDRERHLRRLGSLDPTRVFVADAKADLLSVSGIALKAGAAVTAAITLTAPESAKPGDTYEFDVIQRHRGKVVGGSTYVVAVFDTTREEENQPRRRRGVRSTAVRPKRRRRTA
jgi:hypothetical protein